MTSERKVRANRVNARTSTGPRTDAGKARAARNAQRHGLTLSALADPTRGAELNILARTIAGQSANSELLELATLVAAAQIDVVRVRLARNQLLSRALKRAGAETQHGSDISKNQNGVKHAAILADISRRLLAFDRYERRALSRRKFAVRIFDTTRAGLSSV